MRGDNVGKDKSFKRGVINMRCNIFAAIIQDRNMFMETQGPVQTVGEIAC